MKVLCQGSYKGSRIYNGDIYNIDNNLYYVMDGATSVFDDYKFSKKGDLYEYMQNMKKYFVNSNDLIKDLQMAIIKSNNEFKDLNKYKEYELPTFTIAVVKDCGELVECYILCDTLISILFKDGHIENIEDRRIDKTKDEFIIQKRMILNDKSLYEEKRDKLLLLNEQVARMKANVKGGFPVGSTVPERIEQGLIKKIDKKLIDRILICSDGYYGSDVNYPKTNEEFKEDYVNKRVEKILKEEKRDDLSYILLEV